MDENVLDVEHLYSIQETSVNTFWLDLHLSEAVDRNRLVRGAYSGLLPIRARVLKLGRIGDLIGTTSASLHVVSDRFRQFLQAADLTGVTLFPVVVEGLEQQAAFHLLTVTGCCGPEYGAQGIQRPDIPPLGLFLDPRDWDGSDLFMPPNANVVLLTARAGGLMRRARLRNLRIEPANYELLPDDGGG